MKRFVILGALVAGVHSPLQAATLITEQNLTQFEAMLPKLKQLPQRAQNRKFALAQHCDWPRHYNELSAQEKDSAYQQKIEQLITEHGFTPVQFVELSAKLTWPVLDSVQPALEVSRQALAFLPPAQRQATEQAVVQGQRYYKTLSGCLTTDDKAALAQHHNRIMAIAKGLGGVEQMLPPGISTGG